MGDQLLFENLDEKLEDEDGFITASWLSITFDLNIDASRRLMAAYLQARDNLSSVYLLTGISKQNDILVKLANSDQLSLAQKSFSFPPKCVVYSIQRRQCKDSLSLACYDLLHNISTDQLKRLTSIPWESSSDPLSCRENQETAQKAPEHVDSPVLPSLAASGCNKKIKTSDFKNFFSKIEKSVQDDKTLENYLATSTKNNIIPKPVESAKLDVSDEDEEFGLKTTSSSQKRKCIVIESDEEKEESSTMPKDCVSTNLFNSKASTKLRNNDKQKKRPTRRKDKLKVLASDSEADSFFMEPTQSEKSPDNVKKIGVKTLSTPSKCEENSRTEKSSCAASLNRIRHQVMKTFADEDGFMVTEKGWECSSDDETSKATTAPSPCMDQNEKNERVQPKIDNPVSLTAPPTIQQIKPPKQSNKKNTNNKPAASKQASLSSFFKPSNTVN
ncbi:unnamed protein product [Schistosoma margrebowiei]|uniref:DNA polymerase delta subunit 3 n=1 Tax=Schistosoma margrebowiei TaxID=48269 RepID=A0A183N730_9TREM|nr:unnamed protein product [Schistosoma margrebowiei]